MSLWDIEQGRERRGLGGLRAVLDTAPPTASPFYQGVARARIVELAVSASEALAFRGSDRAKARTLETRAEYVALAKAQLEPVIGLDEAASILPSLAAVGRAHEAFAQALLDEPPIRRLSSGQQAAYDAQMMEQVTALFVKALRYYTKGIEYAGAVRWTGHPVPEMVRAVERITAQVDALD